MEKRMADTQTQKEFKKSMKDLEKEGFTFKNPRTRNVHFEDRRFSFSRYSIGGMIFVLWNLFALSTWILPHFGIYPQQLSRQQQSVDYSTGAFVDEAINPSKTKPVYIREYLRITEEIDQSVSEIASELYRMVQNGDHDSMKLLQMIYDIEDLKKDVPTEHKSLHEMEQRSNDTLKTLNELVLLAYESGGYFDNNRRTMWSQATNQLNWLMSKRNEAIIRLFQDENIKYYLNQDGSVTYWL
jgi:hypothetical protein